jgi:hypothetical protein
MTHLRVTPLTMASLSQSLRWWVHPYLSLDIIPPHLNVTALMTSLWVVPYSLCGKLDHRFTLTRLISCPDYNLAMNYASSPRCFSSQDLQDGKCHSLMEWQENQIIIFFSKQMAYYSRYATGKKWIIVAATSHIWTWSHWYSWGPTKAIIALFIPCSGYTAWHYQCVPNSDPVCSYLWSSYGHVFGLLQRPLPCPSRLWCRHWSSCTLHLWLANQAHGIPDYALKLILALNFPPSEDVSLSTLWVGHHIYFHSLSTEG